MDSAVRGGNYLFKILTISELSDCLSKNTRIHVLSKDENGNFTNYVNLTKLLKDAMIVAELEEDKDGESRQVNESIIEESSEPADLEDKTDRSSKEIKKRKKRVTQLDEGKLFALHNAGWPASKIADELKCSVSVVYKKIGSRSLSKHSIDNQ